MTTIKGIGHAVLYVSDPEASAAWYGDILGMERVIYSEQFQAIFLSFGWRDHDLALFQAPPGQSLGQQDINHLALELDTDLEGFKAFRRRLIDKDVTITGTVDHGVSYGIYFLDPDGHQLEAFMQRTPAEADQHEAFRTAGVKATPIDLDSITD
jgi:catechol-2,3-dioxygenase